MSIWFKFGKAPIRVIKISQRQQRLKLRRAMITVKLALAQEKTETRAMLIVYKKYSQGLAEREEMKRANAQFLDLLKGLGLGVFVILPFAPVTIPVMIKLGKKVGVDILPSAFGQTQASHKAKISASKESR